MLELRPSEIRYSQDSISNTFTSYGNMLIGITLDKLLTGETIVDRIPKIQVMKINGEYFTADNRRLWVFKRAEELGFLDKIEVSLTHNINARKFTTKNRGMSIKIRRGDPGGVIWKSWTPKKIWENNNNTLSVRSLRVQGPSVMRNSLCFSKPTSNTSRKNIHVFDESASSDTVYHEKAEPSRYTPYNSQETRRQDWAYNTTFNSPEMHRQDLSYNTQYNSKTCRPEVSYNAPYKSPVTHNLSADKKVIHKGNEPLNGRSSGNLCGYSSRTSAFVRHSSRLSRTGQTGNLFNNNMSEKVVSNEETSSKMDTIKSALLVHVDSRPMQIPACLTKVKENDSINSLYVHTGCTCRNNNMGMNSYEKCVLWLYDLLKKLEE